MNKKTNDPPLNRPSARDNNTAATKASPLGSLPSLPVGSGKPKNPNSVVVRKLDHDDFDSHEQLHFISEPGVGLNAIIALHSSSLGPTCGGCRMYPYENSQDALRDALRLSKGMTYKAAMVNLPLGGAKSVIIGDPNTVKTPELLAAFARHVENLEGQYWTAEDMNITPNDVEVMAEHTRYVTGRRSGPAPSGDPAPITALGVFEGIKECVAHIHGGNDDLKGVRVAVRGLGGVGGRLARLLAADGAQLVLADADLAKAERIASELGARTVHPDALWAEEVEVFSPNVRGAEINRQTIPALNAKIVAGAANNQLDRDDDGDLLKERGILYAPDYIINAGGLINCYAEMRAVTGIATTFDPEWVKAKLADIRANLRLVFAAAAADSKATNKVADEIARQRVGR